MTNVETMGVDCGGGDVGGSRGAIRTVERAVLNTPSALAAGASFKGGA
jgi:hypothetical protein